MPVIALLNQKGGVGKTTLSIAIAKGLARNAKVLLVDADSQGSALDWSAQRQVPASFSVIGLPRPTIHREIQAISRGFDWIVIDGPPRTDKVAKSAICASDIVLIPVQPSPFDIWAAQDIADLIAEWSIEKAVIARFLINRLFVNTTLATEVKEALAGFDIPVLATVIRNRTDYAKGAKFGLTVQELRPQGAAAEEIRAVVEEITALISPKEKTYVATVGNETIEK